MNRLLAAAILICLVVPAAVECAPPVQDVERATRELASLKWHTMKPDAGGNVVYLDISEQNAVNDAMLAVVLHLPHLKEFYAIWCPIRGDGLANFVGLQELEKLDLHATRVDDRAFQYISKLTALKYLDVTSVGVPADGKPRSAYGDISDKGLALISKLPNLETLHVTGVMTDQGLHSLVGLKKLRELEIGSNNITADGIKWLQTAMPKLDIVRE